VELFIGKGYRSVLNQTNAAGITFEGGKREVEMEGGGGGA